MEKETITLYRYQKYDLHLIQLLANKSFYCAKRSELNDPFDLNFKINDYYLRNKFANNPLFDSMFTQFYNIIKPIRGIDEDILETTTGKINTIVLNERNLQVFTDIILDEVQYRVVSFTGKEKEDSELKEKDTKQIDKNILMWAHYAKFNGVRLTFELPKEFIAFNRKFKIERVTYTDEPKEVMNDNDIYQLLHTKATHWGYENEYRIILQYIDEIGFKPEYLKEITFGNNLEMINRFYLKNIINQFYSNVTFKELIFTASGLSIEDCKYWFYSDDGLKEGRYPII